MSRAEHTGREEIRKERGSLSRQASIESLASIHEHLERCTGIVQEVQELGAKMKRTPVMKPAANQVMEMPLLSIEMGKGEMDSSTSSGLTKSKNQSKKPPASPVAREPIGGLVEKIEGLKGDENRERWLITEEDVGDIPPLTTEELVQEIPREKQLILAAKEILNTWQNLAEEMGITRREVEIIVGNAKAVVDIRMSTYPVQLFKVVTSAILRKGGKGSLQTNRRRINQEIRKAVEDGELKEEQVEQVERMEEKRIKQEENTRKFKREDSQEKSNGGSQRENKGNEGSKDERTKGKEKEKLRRLRTQLGGLYSSDSEKDDSSDTSTGESEWDGRNRRRSRGVKRRNSSSTDRSTSSDISPRREKQRRDKEYLQAVRATRPGKYNGDTQKPQALVSWLTQMTQYFSLMNLGRRDEVRIAISYLEEEAATWWTQVPKHRKKQIKSWRKFKEYVVREFLPHDYNLALWRKLDATYQRTSVAEYVARFHEIQRQLFDLPRKVAKTKLLNGLKPNIRGHVLALRPRTQREVVRLARNFDEAFFSKTNITTDRNQWYRTDGSQQRGKIFNMQNEMRENFGEMNMIAERRNDIRSRDSRKSIESKGNERKQIKCFNCGKMGHIARECWAPKKPFNRASMNTSGSQEKEGENLKEKPQ